MWSLYVLICPIDNMVRYVGISKNPERRYKDHLKTNKNFRKREWLDFLRSKGRLPYIKIVKEVPSRDDILKSEIDLISIMRYLVGEKLTNLTKGGESFPTNSSEEERRFLSQKRKDFLKKNPQHIKRGKDNHFFGKKWTEEQKRERSEKYKGENSPNFGKKFSEETKRKISEARKGIVMPQDVRERIRNSTKGTKNHFYGKNHSEETRSIMSEKKRELLKDPTKNSMYGRIGSNNPRSKKVIQYDINTGEEINRFNSIREAFDYIAPELCKSGSSSISAACVGKLKSYRGYIWKYASEKD